MVPRKEHLMDIHALVPMSEQGWIDGKTLPDGRLAGVALMTYGKGQLQVGDRWVINDSW